MKVFFDTSALVKLLMAEDGAGTARSLWDSAGQPVVSALAYPEACSAIELARRTRRLGRTSGDNARHELTRFWRTSTALDVTGAMAERAGEVASTTGLKGADAVHLATALSVLEEGDVFVTWDRRLSRAARDVGLAVAP